MAKNEAAEEKVEKGKFIVRVQYRRNATWQGNIVWSDRHETKCFRSALELLKMIDSALEESGVCEG